MDRTNPGNARVSISAALNARADQLHEKIDALALSDAAEEIAFLRVLASHVTGWTHTTRLREFLESASTGEDIEAETERVMVQAGGEA